MARGMGPRQPRWTKQGFGVGRPKAAEKSTTIGASPRTKAKALAQRQKAAKSAAAGSTPKKGWNPTSPERVTEIIQRLDATYPGVTCALTHKNPWQLLVATILSAQCTD